jgi:hypothetical protein
LLPPVAALESFDAVTTASLQKRNATVDDAKVRAQDLADQSGVTVHVLDSDGQPALRPGYWVVYIGEMNRRSARYYAEILRNRGYDAYAQEVSG